MHRAHPDVRRLLRLVRYPAKLDNDPLAGSLRDALGAESALDAMVALLRKALPGSGDVNQMMRAAITSQDFDGAKSRQVAAKLGLSVRSYFRYRSTAIELIAMVIDRELQTDAGGNPMLAPRWRAKFREALQMKSHCERCSVALSDSSAAFICSFECTFCPNCAHAMHTTCPNCGGELLQRPRRADIRAALPV